ncbi:Six-hairpin glycosidase-like protein [Trichophaea hybrida]|nr:Six-hairpin glycosidase-like protein [Trichophaea hybrida]
MERESFENDDIAKILNENFVPIKIDREERPDIDRIYMNFVQATTGSGGWPLNVFLTPDLKPVFGGTYWPGPNAVGSGKGQLGFQEVLEKIVQTWKEQPDKFLASADEILLRLKEFTDEGLNGVGEGAEETLELDLLEEAYQQFNSRYDSVRGGFGLLPKFPVPVKLALLLRMGAFPAIVKDIIGERECENAKHMAITTLTNMAKGGIHDQIGYGFARYSVTADWSLPHFEKMLYDNAQLLSVYLDAWLVTGDQLLLDTAIDTADYLCDDALKNPAGGSSHQKEQIRCIAKQIQKSEGAFYVWTRKELDAILGAQESSICARYWNVHRDGNVDPEDDVHDEFIHQNVLSVVTSIEQLGQAYGMAVDKIDAIIKEGRKKLLEHRNKERPRPNLDDKIITSWNGLAIAALSRATAALASYAPESAKKYRENAVQTASFIKKNLYDEKAGLLKRVYHEGPGDTPGFVDDYVYLIHGLIYLYEATFDAGYLKWAAALQKKQIELFWDGQSGGFFVTEGSADDLILRLKDGLDSQEPSTNGLSANNLFRLSSILGDDEYALYARKTCTAFEAEILEHPSMFSSHMSSIVASNIGMRSIVLAGTDGDPEIAAQLKEIRSRLLPNTTLILLRPNIAESEDSKWLLDTNPLYRWMLENLEARNGKPIVQVCEGKKCLDTFDMNELGRALKNLG